MIDDYLNISSSKNQTIKNSSLSTKSNSTNGNSCLENTYAIKTKK